MKEFIKELKDLALTFTSRMSSQEVNPQKVDRQSEEEKSETITSHQVKQSSLIKITIHMHMRATMDAA